MLGTKMAALVVSRELQDPYRALQSISCFPDFFRNSFVLEKCLQPKKPLCTERGEGCAVCRTWCRFCKKPEALDFPAPHA